MFSKGKSFSVYPIKVLYEFIDDPTCTLQAGVTVSSRNFKKAVDRNRVKRVLREAYRIQKLPLQNFLKEQKKSLAVFFIYTGKELPVFAEVLKKLEVVLQKLTENLFKKLH